MKALTAVETMVSERINLAQCPFTGRAFTKEEGEQVTIVAYLGNQAYILPKYMKY